MNERSTDLLTMTANEAREHIREIKADIAAKRYTDQYRRGYSSALADTHHVDPTSMQTMYEALGTILDRDNLHEEVRQFLAGRFDAYSAYFMREHLKVS